VLIKRHLSLVTFDFIIIQEKSIETKVGAKLSLFIKGFPTYRCG
jgi:hypothetical protein